MSYMNCVRCGLSVRLRTDRLAWEYCPRCQGRSGVSVPMYFSERRPGAPEATLPRLPLSESQVEADIVVERTIPTHLVIDRASENGVVELRLHGELDLASSPLLEGEIEEVEGSAHSRLVIDLSELEFMDSTGLHVLVAAHERSLANGHQLSLRRGQPAVQRIFELTNTVSIFRFDD
jgi:anti-anti-sigma factor